MTYAEAKRARDALDAEVSRLSAALSAFPKGALGLTPDAIKAQSDYQDAKRAYDRAFSRLREFNSVFVKSYRADILADRATRFTAGMVGGGQ